MLKYVSKYMTKFIEYQIDTGNKPIIHTHVYENKYTS